LGNERGEGKKIEFGAEGESAGEEDLTHQVPCGKKKGREGKKRRKWKKGARPGKRLEALCPHGFTAGAGKNGKEKARQGVAKEVSFVGTGPPSEKKKKIKRGGKKREKTWTFLGKEDRSSSVRGGRKRTPRRGGLERGTETVKRPEGRPTSIEPKEKS